MYARWAAAVHDGFRFAVKVPRATTHEARLRGAAAIEPVMRLLDEARALEDRLGPFLVQLPPSLAFDVVTAHVFFAAFRTLHDGDLACEPRHPSWFESEADALLAAHRVARVAADPARVPTAAVPGGWDGLAYVRWHGSPRIYFSAYAPERLDEAARTCLEARSRGASAWCILDNTAHGRALGDALGVLERVGTSAARLARGGPPTGNLAPDTVQRVIRPLRAVPSRSP